MKTDKFVHQALIAKSEVIEKYWRKRNKKLVIVISLLNVGLLVLLWILLTTPNTVAQHSSNDPSLVGDIPSPLIGKSAPDFTLPMLNSNNLQMRLSDLKGKPFIVNFWGSTCPPCQQETPFLTQEWLPLQAKDITLVGIDEEERSCVHTTLRYPFSDFCDDAFFIPHNTAWCRYAFLLPFG